MPSSHSALFFHTVTITGLEGGFGAVRLLGGLVFLLGLVLVIVGGAELFTGSCLILLSWAVKRVSAVELLRNWASVYLGNFIWSEGSSLLVHFSGTLSLGDRVVQSIAIAITKGTMVLPFLDAFVRGILCNVFVCVAIWTNFAAHHVSGKVIAIVFPSRLWSRSGSIIRSPVYILSRSPCSQVLKTSISRTSSLIFCRSPSATL